VDLASIIGAISGIVLIIIAIYENGELSQFFDLPAVMIVFGGTVSSTLLTFQLKDVVNAFKAAFFVFSEKYEDPNDMVSTIIELCTLSRRQGLKALSQIETPSDFLKKACMLIADGSKEEMLRDTLQIEIESMKQRHFIIQDVFRKMANNAPGMGMIGTLIGLVEMLHTLSDPDKVGPAMAVALVCTFYGASLGTMFFLPIAGKLRARTLLEVINLQIIFEGAISILSNNNPMMVYEKLSSFIPAKQRRPMQRKIMRG
jgi:chemotaxis protein MotA